MNDCKHGLEQAWCAVCRDTLAVRSPDTVMCCSPNCPKAAAKTVASLPLCQGHYNHLANHVSKVYGDPDWERLHRQYESEMALDWVYFVRIDEVIKIGHSRRLLPRIRSFGSYGHRVEVLSLEFGGRDLENRLHRKFANHRISNAGLSRELFEPCQKILDYIDKERTCALCGSKAKPGSVTCSKHKGSFPLEEELIGVQLHVSPAVGQ